MAETLQPEVGTDNFLDGIDSTSIAEVVAAGDTVAQQANDLPAGAEHMVGVDDTPIEVSRQKLLACVLQIRSGGNDEHVWTQYEKTALAPRFQSAEDIANLY